MKQSRVDDRETMSLNVRHGRVFRCAVSGWLWAFLIVCCPAAQESKADASAEITSDRPNVLMIAVDDLNCALGCYGDVLAQTPHLDALAQRGVLFQHAYCQIPLCNPSRASVMTGLRPDITQVFDLTRHFRETLPDVVTLPELFRRQGWFTARVGKIFHYDVPKGIGTNGLDDPQSWNEVLNPKGRDVAEEVLIENPTPSRPISAALSWHTADGSAEEQTDGIVATEAIRLIGEHRQSPFFLAVGFYRPHTPYVAPSQDFAKYPLEAIGLPFSLASDREDIPAAAFAHNCLIPDYGLSSSECRKAIQAYRACVSLIDSQVGRLIEALDSFGLSEKTIVVLWSDHGYHLGEHGGVWQKRTLFENSLRVPFLIYDPRQTGSVSACPRVVELIDLYPTVAELCGLTCPEACQGRSLVPLLLDPLQSWNHPAVSQILRPGMQDGPIMGRSIRTQRWRLTEWNDGKNGIELYDYASDPHEFHNLADRPEHQERVTSLRERLIPLARPLPPDGGFNAEKL